VACTRDWISIGSLRFLGSSLLPQVTLLQHVPQVTLHPALGDGAIEDHRQ